MTAQVPDLVVAWWRAWSLAGVDGGPQFDPAAAGVTPGMISTACWRGYACRYQVKAGRFRLAGLALGTRAAIGGRDVGPGTTVLGRPAVPAGGGDRWLPGDGFWFRGLDLPVAFTGRLLVGRGVIGSAMVNMGYHPAWKYQAVLELHLTGGQVTARRDRSADLARGVAAGSPFGPVRRGQDSEQLTENAGPAGVTATDDGTRLSTHSRSRRRFAAVWLLLPSPSMHDWPSHQAEDIGARLALPSGLRELIRTTGVPKYSTLSPGTTCIPDAFRQPDPDRGRAGCAGLPDSGPGQR